MKTTKELARELGLLRKRYVPTSVHADKSKKLKLCTGQVFSYLVVIDFESTCWQDGKFRTQEIIEFPAVLCNTRTGEIESVFHYYVQPHEQPVLSDFCKQLTGITQSQVEDGIPLSLCLRKFFKWLSQIKQEKNIIFEEGEGARATFVTWSDWDLGVCLLYEARRKQLTRPPEMNSWIDLRATYRKFYGRKPHGLNGALQDVGIEFQGREHSGVDDARNTARLAWRMMRDGCILNVTKNIMGRNQNSENGTSRSKSTGLTTPRTLCEPNPAENSKVLRQTKLGTSLLCNGKSPKANSVKKRGLQLRDTNISDSYSPNKKISKVNTPKKKHSPLSKTRRMSDSSNGLKMGTPSSSISTGNYSEGDQACTDKSSVQSTCTCDSKLGKPRTPNNKDTGLKTTDSTLVTPISSNKTSGSAQMTSNVFKTPTQAQTSNVSKTPSPAQTSNISKTPSPAQTSSNVFKTPSPAQTSHVSKTPSPAQTSNISKTPTPAQTSHVSKTPTPAQTSNVSKTPTQAQTSHVSKTPTPAQTSNVFKTPSPVQTSTIKLKTTSLRQSVSANVFKTPSPAQRSHLNTSNSSSAMRATPPMCKCGRRSKRRMVQSPGPNIGRFFFTCGVRTSQYDKNRGCDFFQWETPSGGCKSSRHVSKTGSVSKPFTPVFNMNFETKMSQTKRQLGVRSTVPKTIR